MKQEVKLPVIVIVGVIVVAFIAWFGFKQISTSGSLDQGQIKYTPGKPPWEESNPAMRGPGGSPGAGATAPAQPNYSTPATAAPNDPTRTPPGMGPPTIGNTSGSK